MTSAEEYLGSVRRAMVGMEPSVRDDILQELRSHVTESVSANGGNVGAALSALGSPTEVGRRYRDVYGFGRVYRFLFAVISFLLALPSIPVLAAGDQSIFPLNLSILFLIVVAAWVMWVGVAAGSRAGLAAGVAALVGRFAAFGLVAATQPGAVTTLGGIGLLVAASVALVILGWLPGTAKRAWSSPRAEL
ncbi:MAG TPA: hypothetical protein VJP06_00500 [Thermoplasmata archaeon]|nr:hypothetical protein [Thermoplasmata archaeon]